MTGPQFRGDDGGVGDRDRRIRHPDRDRPRAQSALAYAVFVLVAEGLWGIHG